MNMLIYTVAIGETYQRLAKMMILSLRNLGYNGRVAVISDNDDLFRDLNQVFVFLVNPTNAKAMKCEILKFFPGYDRYFFVDADVLWVDKPDLFFADEGDVIVTPLKDTIADSKNNEYGMRYSLQYMSKEDIKHYGDEPVFCSGHFSVSAKSAKTLFDNWREVIDGGPMTPGHPFSDQAAFQVAVRRTGRSGHYLRPNRKNGVYLFGRQGATQGTTFVSGTTCLIHAYNPKGGNRLSQFKKAIAVAMKDNPRHNFTAPLAALFVSGGW